MERFTLKREHLKLLRAAYCRWDDCEFGFTLMQAAIALGVQPSTVKRWEDGDMEPRGLSLERIERVLAESKGE